MHFFKILLHVSKVDEKKLEISLFKTAKIFIASDFEKNCSLMLGLPCITIMYAPDIGGSRGVSGDLAPPPGCEYQHPPDRIGHLT